MGMNDAAEMLEVAKQECARLEQERDRARETAALLEAELARVSGDVAAERARRDEDRAQGVADAIHHFDRQSDAGGSNDTVYVMLRDYYSAVFEQPATPEPTLAGACHVCLGTGIVEDFDGEDRPCPVSHREPRLSDFESELRYCGRGPCSGLDGHAGKCSL